MYKLFIIVPILFVTGCQSDFRPDGLPSLVPFQLTLTQDGQPLAGADVQLFSSEVPWPVTGNTDSSGTTKIVTYGKFPGAPLGTFKVLVTKTETEGDVLNDPSANSRPAKPTYIYSLVDTKLRNQETTTLEITVEKGKKSATLDVGKPVRLLIDTIKPGGA